MCYYKIVVVLCCLEYGLNLLKAIRVKILLLVDNYTFSCEKAIKKIFVIIILIMIN